MQTRLFTKGKTNMTAIMKTSIYLPMAAMFLTAALAGPAAAEKQLPFSGSVQGRETDVFQDPPREHYWSMGAARESPPILVNLL
jgi:hypothetical protein